VELSIVLIIIGLIVGGVLGGQSLIKSAELQRVVNELNQYKTAINAFRLEYNALPGDMDNAQDYWGDNCVSDTKYIANCNGDGDGGVDDNHEDYQAFRHLSLAGIVPGSFSGFEGQTKDNQQEVGVHIPESAIGKGVGYQFDFNWQYPAGCQHDFCETEVFGHGLFAIVGEIAIKESATKAYWSAFTPKQLSAIDTKIDDGVPLQGFLKSPPNSAGAVSAGLSGCVALNGAKLDFADLTNSNINDDLANANYNFAKQENVCQMQFQVF
jgi:type II secretory pathway pseudopilin PulG